MNKPFIFPKIYRNNPYFYRRTREGITIKKNTKEYLLYGDDETQFIIDCCYALDDGRSIKNVMQRYIS